MANVFGILTAIVLALSAFIALKNKSTFETQISETGTQKDLLATNEGKLKAKEKQVEELPVERDGVNAEVDTLTASEAAQQKTNASLKEANEAKTTKVSANKAKLDDIRAKVEKSGNLKELASKMRATNTELEELSQSIAATEAKLANLTAQNNSASSQVDQAKGKFDSFAGGQSIASLKTRIRSIYPNWGFVTLASGNNAGVVANSTLNVVRGGETIAKLLVTAVESSSASASIVPDSLAADVTLMVGDRVEPGAKADKPAPAATAAAAAAAATAAGN